MFSPVPTGFPSLPGSSSRPGAGNPGIKRYRRGSSIRGGASVVASGTASPGFVSVADAASQTFDIDIIEDTFLAHLVVQGAAEGMLVTAISIDNDGLINGEVPANIFRPDSVVNPLFMHLVSKNSTIRVTVENNSGAAVNVSVGFTAAPLDARIAK